MRPSLPSRRLIWPISISKNVAFSSRCSHDGMTQRMRPRLGQASRITFGLRTKRWKERVLSPYRKFKSRCCSTYGARRTIHQVLLASQECPDAIDITASDNVSTGISSIPQATITTTLPSTTSIASDITMQMFQQQMAMMQQLMMQQLAMAQQTDSTPSSLKTSASGINKNIVGHMGHATMIVQTVGRSQTDTKTPPLSNNAKGAAQKILSDYLSGIVFLLNLIY